MQKVLLYIATSLDGFIARQNDDVSWLDSYQVAGEDYGYSAFMDTVGCAVMGSRTYTESLKHPERLLNELKMYVLSSQPLPVKPESNVEFYSGTVEGLTEKIKRESDKDIYVVGGGKIVSSFLNANLMDEMYIFIVPILLKQGIPLYSALNKEIKLKILETVSYKTGIVKLHYEVIKN